MEQISKTTLAFAQNRTPVVYGAFTSRHVKAQYSSLVVPAQRRTATAVVVSYSRLAGEWVLALHTSQRLTLCI